MPGRHLVNAGKLSSKQILGEGVVAVFKILFT